MSESAVFWSSCLAVFESELTPQQFNTWIKPLSIEDAEDGFRLLVPNRFVLNWVKDKFLGRIASLAQEYFEAPREIELVVAVAKKTAAKPEATESNGKKPSAPAIVGSNKGGPPLEPATGSSTPTKGRPLVDEYSRLNPNFTFETFVNGKANQLARAAAMQVADNPGVAYNPLFVYGGVGLGKTHLAQAIGNFVQQHNKQAKIRYIHAEKYVGDVVKAYQHKAFDEFKRYYHSLDVLLIDDIQFFSGKNRTQEEFFYAFNALIEAHKQVIITCDTFPREIENMEDRLISRFGWGLTVAIEPPELEMRVAILLKKAESERVLLDENTAFFIAKHIRSNVRELEGALKRVLAYSRFTGQKVTLELAKEALKDLLAVQNRQISIDNIQKTVADFYKIKVADMHSSRRTRNVARPRQVAMALAKELTQLSLPDIGEAFGGRDHTTVLHACRKIAELRGSEPELAHEFNVLLQILKN
ncbi:chromosomal replication initiator protein DnaA [Leeia sp. TBRC 13508]|uniref:Chromosomal replication initiator protein DnaA n=1 Tax=Leeia speluncae TaxID=2884804 RepID=A0ABS8D443_9NEIS|nr:chromosomal replication initiator protein DnaA [Leeia speluncae]MCB6182962.1 chromosomal replication initiator protein DnaA [Leeia speluncae]